MDKYEHIVYCSKEDNCFIVEVPELSSCMTNGKTRSETIENCEIIIQEWIETTLELGKTIPKSKKTYYIHKFIFAKIEIYKKNI